MITFALLVLAVSTATLTLTRSTVFYPLRVYCRTHKPLHFVGEMLRCPYCTAHWVSLWFTWFFGWWGIPHVVPFAFFNMILVALAVVPFTIPIMVIMFEGIPRLAIEE